MHNLIKFLYLGGKVAQSCKEDGIGKTFLGALSGLFLYLFSVVIVFAGMWYASKHYFNYDDFSSFGVSALASLFLLPGLMIVFAVLFWVLIFFTECFREIKEDIPVIFNSNTTTYIRLSKSLKYVVVLTAAGYWLCKFKLLIVGRCNW